MERWNPNQFKNPIHLSGRGNSEKSRQLIVNIPDIDGWFISAAPALEISSRIADMKNRIGGRPMEYVTYAFGLVTNTEAEAIERLRILCPGKRSSIDWALKTGLVGPPRKIIERIQEMEEACIDHIALMLSSTLDDMKVFYDPVIKQLH
jgi:hypothetical protein